MVPVKCSAVGISYRDANCFLDQLETEKTEVHGIVVMRHGSTAFEGYWAPYGPGVIHGDQSLTKTVTGIALGAAIHEGLIRLDERLIDIFPEYRPLTEGKPYWDELQLRHIATMSAGMDTQPAPMRPGFVEGFFQTEIHHRPGTAYMYNSIACSMVGMCIKKRSGQGLLDYLSDRVFRKIGIDPGHLMWHRHPDGIENGSGGFVSTTRDNALLMELYRRGGVWNDERILDADWVDFALRVQNPHVGGDALYGGMMWIRQHTASADGAMGQWSILFPEKDTVVSITQTITDPKVDARVRQHIEDFVLGLSDHEVPWTEEEEAAFTQRLARLCIPHPECRENASAVKALCGRTLRVADGSTHFFADDLNIFDLAYVNPVRSFCFERQGDDLVVNIDSEQGRAAVPVALRGYRPVFDVPPLGPNPARTSSVTGFFPDDHTLVMEVRWLESCRVHFITVCWNEEGADITTSRVPVGGFDVPDETVHALWC